MVCTDVFVAKYCGHLAATLIMLKYELLSLVLKKNGMRPALSQSMFTGI